MAQQHQVRTRFVSIEPNLLQPPPEPLKINLGQFFAHVLLTLSKAQLLSGRLIGATAGFIADFSIPAKNINRGRHLTCYY
jgi:hypothetical protein